MNVENSKNEGIGGEATITSFTEKRGRNDVV